MSTAQSTRVTQPRATSLPETDLEHRDALQAAFGALQEAGEEGTTWGNHRNSEQPVHPSHAPMRAELTRLSNSRIVWGIGAAGTAFIRQSVAAFIELWNTAKNTIVTSHSGAVDGHQHCPHFPPTGLHDLEWLGEFTTLNFFVSVRVTFALFFCFAVFVSAAKAGNPPLRLHCDAELRYLCRKGPV